MEVEQPVNPQAKKATPKWLLPVAILVAVVIAVIAIVAIVRQAQNNVANEAIPASVVVTGSGFTPAVVKVKAGDSVTWVNKDSTPHQIVSLEPNNTSVAAFDSRETLGQGDSYTYTFEKAGTFTYGDKVEPTLYKGTVIVE
ncbi:cupredoxin domain-containing protein [Candidatus Saccharibacteria bacterium]|nr:cupredoxin domain-containing protein [Candidatus Saccharibacteria bacterium]